MWSLETMFAGPLGASLVFKGGTSLSKAYRAIRCFSEDVDLTHDIRALRRSWSGTARMRCRPTGARSANGRRRSVKPCAVDA